jgi:hypothetical protein
VPAARSGAFAANFNPDTLNQFRDLCKQHGRQYTKVLERLAEIYLATNGELLNSPSVPRSPFSPNLSNTSIDSASFQDLLKRLEQLEVDYRKADEHLGDLIGSLEKRVQNLE